MNELEKEVFDYSIVDNETASFLKLKEQEMQTIVLNNSLQIGEKLIEAQEKLAKFNKGTFEKWFLSVGLKKRTVYNYISQTRFVHQMHESEQIEMFQELPTSLKTEVSKPSVKPEVAEAIMNGDVKTKKEVEELKKRLKAKDEQILLQAKTIDDLSEQEPQIVEKKVVVEKVPDDYEAIKKSYSKLEKESFDIESKYRQLLKERQEVDEKSNKYEQLSQAINQAQGELNQTQQLISNYKQLSELLEKSNQFLSAASALIYQDLSEVITRDGLAKRELDFLIERLSKFLSDLTKINKNQIFEGEIINE